MKKLFLSFMAVLLICGMAYAVSLPQAEDASNGPGIWLIPVYNNTASTLDVGSIVIWDIDASTGDNDNYVTTTTTADTALVAGVIYPSDIAAYASGPMAIRGVVTCDLAYGAIENAAICTSIVAGEGKPCGADHTNQLGFATAAIAGNGSGNCMVTLSK